MVDVQPNQRRGEGRLHQELKTLGLRWLEEQGCRARALEVRLPLSRYRVDVAGYRSARRMGVWGETFAVECKASRADFLRDVGEERAFRDEVTTKREEVERLRMLLARHLPACRVGRSLFAEFDGYDFSDLRHERWRKLVARVDRLERQLSVGVKFSRMVRYGVANQCWLLVGPDVIQDEREVPLGWGCLLRRRQELVVLKQAIQLESRTEAKLAYLERIAARAQLLTKAATIETVPMMKQ